jgi:hypothetical protein
MIIRSAPHIASRHELAGSRRCADDNNTDNIPGDDAEQWFNHHCAADDKELVKNLAKKDTPWMKLVRQAL